MDRASFLFFTGSLGSCFGVVVILYNLVAVALYLREDTAGQSSAVGVVAWAIGVLAMLLWWLPCVGGLAGGVAMVVALLEHRRICREESSLASATPVRMGRWNGRLAVALQAVLLTVLLVNWAIG